MEDCNQLLENMNSLHSNIKFTVEYEKDECIPFLDVLLIRISDGSISRSIFRKATFTGQYLHFDSFVPIRY